MLGTPVARRRAAVAATVAAAAAAYVAHRRGYLRAGHWPLLSALAAYRRALLTGGDVAARLTGDLRSFLESEDPHAEVPASLRQLLRLAQCSEAQRATEALTAALCRGAVAGAVVGASEAAAQRGIDARALVESALETAASERGRGLVSCLVAQVARQAVEASMEAAARRSASGAGGGELSAIESLPRVLAALDSESGRRVLCELVSSFTRGAVGAYLQDAQDEEFCDRVVRSVTRPEHREGLGELASRVTGEAVRTLVQTAATEYTVARANSGALAGPSLEAGGTPLPGLPSPWLSSRASPMSPGFSPPRTFILNTKQRAGLGGAEQLIRGGGLGRRVHSLPGSPACPGDDSFEDSASGLLPGRCAACGVDSIALRRQSAGGATCGTCAARLNNGEHEEPSPGHASEACGSNATPAAVLRSLRPGADAGVSAERAAEAGWTSTARAVLSLAAEPEARVVLREVAGAMAGSSVRALCSVVPDAVRSVMPSMPHISMPFRRGARASHTRTAAAAAGEAGGAEGEPEVVRGGVLLDVSKQQWRSMEAIKVQGALAFALLLHAAAFVPSAAGRFG